MENRRGNEIFLGVVGVATLVVAIIGATFAYFSASVRGGNNVVVQSASLELGFKEDVTGLTTLLIPTDGTYANFAGTNGLWIAKSKQVVIAYGGDDGKTPIYGEGKGLCFDDNSNKICGTYDFTVMNPNTTTMNITAEVITTVNTFEAENMMFALYEKTGTDDAGNAVYEKIGEDLAFASPSEDGTEAVKEVPAFDFRMTAAGSAVSAEDRNDPSKYTAGTIAKEEKDANENIIGKTVRDFRMVIYLKETKTDQTEKNSGKMLTAAIKIKTIAKDGTEGSGITGVIAAANAKPAA